MSNKEMINYLEEKRKGYIRELEQAQRKRDIFDIRYYMERIEYIDEEIGLYKEGVI